jgi:hypothetical protein
MPTLVHDRTSRRAMRPTGGDGAANPNEIVVRVTGDHTDRAPTRASRARRGPTVRGVVVTALLGAVAVGLFLLVGAVSGLFSIGNPFSTTRVDRTQPALLKQLSNLSDYHAAQGTFMVEVDVEDDVNILPSFLAGERTIFRARGTVDSTVDFADLGGGAVQAQDQSVTITLPEPAFAKAVVDPLHSEVIDRDRGLFTRIGDAFSDDTNNERDLYRLAGKKLDAAARESSLRDRAERNTTLMLEGLLGRLGYTDVQVVFAPSAGKGASGASGTASQ